jgi:DNA processing protein
MPDPPASITLKGGPLEASSTVAVVGSRRACDDAVSFARTLANALVRAGSVVVSGGALGVDAAAHEGALSAGGRTWAVAGTGHAHCFPSEHAALFERIGAGPGAMVWPFAPDYRHRSGFPSRNRVLVALSDAVVIVQAGEQSGALNAASCAVKLGKPLWVVPAFPWAVDFEGSLRLLDEGARPLTSIPSFLTAIGIEPPGAATEDPLPMLPPETQAVFEAVQAKPAHVDLIAAASGQTAQVAIATLLTLALENVVVEGPPGFFRRTTASKH